MPDLLARRHYVVSGTVQGVGFRPFVFRLAAELNLSGWIRNSPAGVEMELQGPLRSIEIFETRFNSELPPLASITSLTATDVPQLPQESGFHILVSTDGRAEAQIAPDAAICRNCLQELLDPADRRYLHPFITCTNCGPRWTIVTGIPYDRPLTTMAGFPLCPACDTEYRNPLDRRFHAQPIACPDCGPQLSIYPPHPAPLQQAKELLRQGKIVAIKGLGGYHLAVDACNDEAVARLRCLKERDEKPFAVMVPDIETARMLADLSEMEERLFGSPEAPIVIVRRYYWDTIPNQTTDSGHVPIISDLVAPESQWIGLMLAYTPLHQLLFSRLSNTGDTIPNQTADLGHVPCIAIVMTSANRSDEPMIADDNEAVEKLSGIADAILAHNRPIHVRTDDSVIRAFQGRPLFYRRSRGYVPRPVPLTFDAKNILAVGGELKNTICLTRGREAFLSQHIGDLKNDATLDTFRQTIEHLSGIMEIKPSIVASDQHPDYLSTRFTESVGLPVIKIQHHHAHMASCMAENGLDGEVIGVILDGTGLGDDGTIWGGEFLVGGYEKAERGGHFDPVRLPGGDAAAKEPWRMALAYLYQASASRVWEMELNFLPKLTAIELSAMKAMLERGVNSPLTSSTGRLFDAVASILGICNRNSFDGQAGMALEAMAEQADEAFPLQFTLLDGNPFRISFAPMILELFERASSGDDSGPLARGFHRSLADALLTGCIHLRENRGLNRVVLSGGVFQNRLLTDMLYTRLVENGFECYLHRLAPPNDGGISLGQAAIAARRVL